MDCAQILDGLTARYRNILADSFVGVYVHGSLAMGSFNPAKSDIDYILVCETEPGDAVKRAILEATLAFEPYAPPKGLEMHLMQREDCLRFQNPPYFCLHYSPSHRTAVREDIDAYIGWMRGRDIDLNSHLTVIGARGICWAGEPIARVFGPVPRKAHIESVLADAEWSPDDCMYHILNNSRTLAFVREGLVLSKREGGEWALSNCDARYAPLLRDAINCLTSDRTMPPSPEAETFCAETLKEIREAI